MLFPIKVKLDGMESGILVITNGSHSNGCAATHDDPGYDAEWEIAEAHILTDKGIEAPIIPELLRYLEEKHEDEISMAFEEAWDDLQEYNAEMKHEMREDARQ